MQTKLPNIKIALTFLLVFFGLNQSKASHNVGADFSYKCTPSYGVYEVTAKIYRDCQGIPLCSNCPTSLSPSCNIPLEITGTGAFEGVSYGVTNLNIDMGTPVLDKTNTCSNVKTVCTNCGTRTPGSYAPGMEVYTFKGLVNLNSLPVSLCTVRLSFRICCRSNGISTIVNPSSTSFYTDFYINKCIQPCNSSPNVIENPTVVMCAGSDQSISLRNEDPDGDSLSYHLAPTLDFTNRPVPYASPFSASIPFPYLDFPAQLPLPSGIHLSPTSGDLMFRPIGNFVSSLVVETKQWKKVGASYTFAGSTRKEFQIYSLLCTQNSPVNLVKYDTLGTYQGVIGYPQDTAIVEVGQKFCRIFVASDSVQTDTTDFTYAISNRMAGASVSRLFNLATRNVNGPRQDSIKFCWTPSHSQASNLPYVFTLMANDRFCPIPAKTTRSLAIYVRKDPSKVSIAEVITNNPKCNGGIPNGSLIIIAANGKGPIQYKINNGNYGSNNVFNNLTAGVYKALVKDSLGFMDSLIVNLYSPINFDVNLTVSSQSSLACKFDSNATCTLSRQYGTPPFMYKQLGKSFQSSPVFENLKAGQITFIVMDSNTCFDTVITSVFEPQNALYMTRNVQHAKCYNSTGSFTLNGYGGSGTYLYSIDNGATFGATKTFTSLTPNLYRVKIKDTYNCIKSDSFILSAATQVISNHTKKNVSCKGGSDGNFILSASGGTPPYRYSLPPSPDKTSPLFNNLLPGTYSAIIKDLNNCESSQTIVINEPNTLLTSTITSGDESCMGANNGWALCTPSGGTPPYYYTWSGALVQFTALATNLGAGKLYLSLVDSASCTIKDSVQIGYKPVYQGENICKVSTDTMLGNHLIVWNKNAIDGVFSYKVFGSANASGGFTQLGSISFQSNPIFIDTIQGHLGKTYYYQIKAADSCNNLSDVVGTHSNVFLSGIRVNNKNEIHWKQPMGAMGIQNILVWRAHGGLPYTQIATLPATDSLFMDSLMPTSGISNYFIELIQSPQCNLFGTFYSNTISILGSTSLIEKLNQPNISIFPNPSNGFVTIIPQINAGRISQIEMYNTLGLKVHNYLNIDEVNNGNLPIGDLKIELNLSQLASGVYYLDISTNDYTKSIYKITISR